MVLIKYLNSNSSFTSIIAILSPSVILTFQLTILLLFNLSNNNFSIVIQSFSTIIVGSIFIIAILKVIKEDLKTTMIIFYLFVFLFIMQLVVFPENRQYIIDNGFIFFFTSLPIFILAFSIKNYSLLYIYLRKAGNLIFIMGIIIGALIIVDIISINTYSASLSYYLLLPAVIYLNEFLKDFSLKMFVFFLISIVTIVLFGSRGAMFCIAIFFVIRFILNIKKYSRRHLSIIFFALVPLTYLLVNIHVLVEKIFIYLNERGLFSRNLYFILNDITSSSGRDNLYHLVLSKTFESPFIGIGIFGDRTLLNGDYAHNILVEIIANFGIIIGVLLIIFYSLVLIKILFDRNVETEIYLIWFCIGLLPLLFSSSYWIYLNFWILNGLILRYLVRRPLNYERQKN